MITSPFPLLNQFQDLLDLRFLTRADAVASDADIARIVEAKNLVGLKQMHGNTAVRVHSASSRVIEADAVATDIPGLTLSIRFADCQNAVIFEPKERVVCLVHAGWRGVQAKVMTSAYELLRAEWNIDPINTFVALGPSLCTKCSDFTDARTEAPGLVDFIQGKAINLRAALNDELDAIGVQKRRIERNEECTRCNPKTYFTYRGGDKLAVQRGNVNCLTATLTGR